MYGYNNVGSNYKRMLLYPNYKQTVIDSLIQIPTDKKVLRFPDGQESIGKPFDDSFTLDFIQFCQEAQVDKVVLRCDFTDIAGSVRTYGLLEANLDVLYVEASNEPYYGANLTVNNFWELLESIFNPMAYHRRKANQYAQKTLNLLQAFKDSGNDITDIFAFACPVPHIAKYEQWYNVLSQRLSHIPNIIFHLYGTPLESTLASLYEWLDYILSALDNKVDSRFNKICTEFSPLHFGQHGNSNYADIAHTPLHKTMHEICLAEFESRFSLIMLHKYMGEDINRFFAKIVVDAVTGNIKRQSTWM